VIRMCIENNFDIDIKSLVKDAAELHQKDFEADDVSSYLLDRLETWYLDQNIDASLFNAIRHSKRGVVSLAQNHSDLLALQEFSFQPAADGLVAANKRVANILKNIDSGMLPSVNRALFEAPIEDQLYTEVETIQSKVIETPEFTNRLALLGELQANIDQYFEQVMVNCEDTETRDNRLATLLSLRQLFLSVADFSLLQL
jgi:glycyl-tRNA synthetase beta chain